MGWSIWNSTGKPMLLVDLNRLFIDQLSWSTHASSFGMLHLSCGCTLSRARALIEHSIGRALEGRSLHVHACHIAVLPAVPNMQRTNCHRDAWPFLKFKAFVFSFCSKEWGAGFNWLKRDGQAFSRCQVVSFLCFLRFKCFCFWTCCLHPTAFLFCLLSLQSPVGKSFHPTAWHLCSCSPLMSPCNFHMMLVDLGCCVTLFALWEQSLCMFVQSIVVNFGMHKVARKNFHCLLSLPTLNWNQSVCIVHLLTWCPAGAQKPSSSNSACTTNLNEKLQCMLNSKERLICHKLSELLLRTELWKWIRNNLFLLVLIVLPVKHQLGKHCAY